METFLFGPGERLFGAYYEGLGSPTAPAVLFCNGLGQDYMRSHFVLRHLARRLSAEGCPVLQFDYRGTGDSWGEPATNTLLELREDAAIALQELREISGRPRVVTLGVRLGAWLALELSDRVVVWDPILFGKDHVMSLKQLASEVCKARKDSPARQIQEAEMSTELAGYRFADRLLDKLAGLSVESFIENQRFKRLALISGDDLVREPLGSILETHADHFVLHPAKSAHWDQAAQLERSLTPFPSLAKLCTELSRW